MRKILVTGAAGFIAYHLIEELLRVGYSVVGIDNFDLFYDRAIKDRNLADLNSYSKEAKGTFQFIETDLTELSTEFLKEVKFDAVIHLAAKAGVQPSLKIPEDYFRVNTSGTLRLLEFCRARGIKNILFGSSSSVYGNDTPGPFSEKASADRPISPYAASKRSAELYCHTYASLYGLKIAVLRFFTVYGPRQRPDLAIHKFTKLISSGQPVVLYGDGSTERDYTYVTDIVSGIVGALNWVESSPDASVGVFEIFNLGGSETTSLKKLVELIEQSMNTTARIQWSEMQPGDVNRTFADLTKSKQYLGYSPQTPIQKGIPRFVEWFLRNHHSVPRESQQPARV